MSLELNQNLDFGSSVCLRLTDCFIWRRWGSGTFWGNMLLFVRPWDWLKQRSVKGEGVATVMLDEERSVYTNTRLYSSRWLIGGERVPVHAPKVPLRFFFFTGDCHSPLVSDGSISLHVALLPSSSPALSALLQQPHLLCLIAAAHLVIIGSSNPSFNSIPSRPQCLADLSRNGHRETQYLVCFLECAHSTVSLTPASWLVLFCFFVLFPGSEILQLLISHPRPDTFVVFFVCFFAHYHQQRHLNGTLIVFTFNTHTTLLLLPSAHWGCKHFSFLLWTLSRGHTTIWKSSVHQWLWETPGEARVATLFFAPWSLDHQTLRSLTPNTHAQLSSCAQHLIFMCSVQTSLYILGSVLLSTELDFVQLILIYPSITHLLLVFHYLLTYWLKS